MPRPSLPSHLQRMTTYDVLLTQTTEEDLKNHFQASVLEYEARWKPYADELERCVSDAFTHNPYLGRSWRKSGPTRLYPKGHEWNRMDSSNDAEVKKYFWIYEFAFDFRRCINEFKWEQFEDDLHMISRCLDTMKSGEDELKRYDERNYANAKKDWEMRDAEWIANEKLRREHENHHPRAWWVAYFERDPDAKKWYKGVIPDNEDTCSLCVYEKEVEARRQQEEAEENARQEEEARIEAEREAEEKAQREAERKSKPVQHYHCEGCEYHTTSSFNYDVHLKSTEHKVKARFCKGCNYQCRSDVEYATHIGTNKHKKVAGEVVVVSKSYHCETCNYTTHRKDAFDRHLASKSHLNKSG